MGFFTKKKENGTLIYLTGFIRESDTYFKYRIEINSE